MLALLLLRNLSVSQSTPLRKGIRRKNFSVTSGLYYKPITIINDDSRVINKLETSVTDDARFIIYEHHMFIVQATDSQGLSMFKPNQLPILLYENNHFNEEVER